MFFELKSPLSPVLKMKYEIFFYGYRFNWEIISIIHLRRGESKIFLELWEREGYDTFLKIMGSAKFSKTLDKAQVIL